MTRRRRYRCIWLFLALVVVFFYQRPFVRDTLRTSTTTNDVSTSLAEDSLAAAVASVHEAMRLLLENYEYDTRSNSPGSGSSKTVDRQRTKFERHQTSVDDFLVLHDSRKAGGGPGVSPWQTPRSNLPSGIDEDASFDICASLAGMRMTMIGGDHIFRLHNHLLQHREHAEGHPFPCLGRKFCTHHHICLPPQPDDSPPKEKPRHVKPPTTQELIETESAVFNYIVSDTLFSSRDETSWEYTVPFLDPMTGVRLSQSFWLAAARKANIIVLGRGPLSAPGSTYAGNWSFLHHVPDYVDKTRGAITGMDRNETVPRPLEIINVAVHLTISRFLPDVFQVLQAIRQEARLRKGKRLIWVGTWYRLPGRGTARMAFLRPRSRSRIKTSMRSFFPDHSPLPTEQLDLVSQLSALLDAHAKNKAELEDPWTLLYNTQGENSIRLASILSQSHTSTDACPVYLQNMLLRALLPRHGIPFLSLNTRWYDDAPSRGRQSSHGTSADVELEITELEVVGKTFLRGLDLVLRSLE